MKHTLKEIYLHPDIEYSLIEAYEFIKPLIFDFTFYEVIQYKDFDKREVCAVFLSSSSYIRKVSTVKRVQDIIDKYGFNLRVVEDGLEATNRFKIVQK